MLTLKVTNFSGFTHLPTPMTGRVELLIYWRVITNIISYYRYLISHSPPKIPEVPWKTQHFDDVFMRMNLTKTLVGMTMGKP